MTRCYNLIGLILLLGLFAGCDLIGGQTEIGRILMTQLSAPDTVAVRDPFMVQFTVENHGHEDIVVKTGSCGLVTPGIFADGERVPFKGSGGLICTPINPPYTIPVGEPVARTFNMQAMRHTSEGDEPVSPGTYTIKVELRWKVTRPRKGERIEKVLERDLVVRP